MQRSIEQAKELLQKLKRLAERGVGGEKSSAEDKLEQLMREYNLTEADLSDDAVMLFQFAYLGPHNKRLLEQIFYKVLGPDDFTIYRVKHTRNKLAVYCTSAQRLEIELDYNFFSSLLEQEIEDLVGAFIQKQDIFPENVPIQSSTNMTEEELKKAKKQQQMMQLMRKRQRAAGLIEGD